MTEEHRNATCGLDGHPLVGSVAFWAFGVRLLELFDKKRQGLVQSESVDWGVCELESECCNMASSRAFPFLSLSVSFLKFSFSCLSLAVSCSISKTGRQFSIAKQRRQSGSVERYSDLLIQ